MKTKSLLIGTLIMSSIFAGCGSSNDEDTNNTQDGVIIEPVEDTIPDNTTILDATSGAVSLLDLNTGEAVSDDSWHIAYQKYIGFKSNGGTSGTKDVSICIAKSYPELFDENNNTIQASFEALTVDNTEDDFNAVTKVDCETANYISDSITTQIKIGDWLDADYSKGAPVYSAKNEDSNNWLIRSATKTGEDYSYAKVSVKNVDVVFGATTTRKVVLSSQKYDKANGSFLESVDSPVLDYSATNRVYWDLETNTIVTSDDNWDLSIVVNGQDYPIQVNGGASGDKSAGVGTILDGYTVSSVTDPADTTQVYKYFADTAEGALSQPGDFGPFSYSVANQHKMWPTFSTYIVKDQEEYFKFQVLSNYGQSGALDSGNLFIRYEKLD